MSIETTITIHEENYALIREVSDQYNLSISRIISLIILLLSDKKSALQTDRFSTQYQQKDKGNYRRTHIYLSEVDFSVSQDLRLVMKSSFSFLVAKVLKLYYEELITLLGSADIYRHQIHCKIYILDQNTKCFKHYWGIPPLEDLEAG